MVFLAKERTIGGIAINKGGIRVKVLVAKRRPTRGPIAIRIIGNNGVAIFALCLAIKVTRVIGIKNPTVYSLCFIII